MREDSGIGSGAVSNKGSSDAKSSANVSGGSQSSASVYSLTSLIRYTIVGDAIAKKEDHSFITKVERDRIKSAYPKLSPAREPSVSKDTNII